jgi:hypothetical protein
MKKYKLNTNVKWDFFFPFLFYIYGTGDLTQGPAHAKQVLCHLVTPPAPDFFISIQSPS